MGVAVSKELAECDAADNREAQSAGAAGAAKRTLLELSRLVGPESNGLYQVPLVGQQAYHLDTNHCFVGAPSSAPKKVILLMGKTGAGKSTIANWLLNYVYGVEFWDSYRFQLIKQATQVTSDTNKVTSYTINHQPGMRINYSLTIVDSPGFQSTGGMAADQHIREQLEEYFGVPQVDREVDDIHSIHGVCVLVTAATQKLTASEEYVFKCIKEVFGADIGENISILFTFSDQCESSAKKVVEEAHLPYSADFYFNNGDILKVPAREGNERYNMLSKFWWEERENQTSKFFETLDNMPAKTSKMTRATLGERLKVERSVSSLETQIGSKLNELNLITGMQDVVRKNTSQINDKDTFTLLFQVESLDTVPLTDGSKATNCQTCKFTCHVPCCTTDDRSRSKCLAMTPGGMCRHCPDKCSHTKHTSDSYVYERKLKTVEKSSETLLSEFAVTVDDILTGSSRSEQVLNHLKTPLKKVLQDIAEKVKEIQESLDTLEEVALAKVPKDASKYIELLISMEEGCGKPGYKDRIRMLRDERHKQEILRLIYSARRSSEGHAVAGT
ncbi:uncharacterized protein LOC135501372 [Lineus longissimus]|uniref:uncharacterized protein LOC135501372 n=1 Tax=Lineus longissimus TaxID=88925 RepID=UPI00315D6437